MHVEPYAYAVYFPDQPEEQIVHDLQELLDDLTNRVNQVTELYSIDQLKDLLDTQERLFVDACKCFGKAGEVTYASYKVKRNATAELNLETE